MQELEFRAMGCGMRAIVDADSDAAYERLRRIPQLFAEWEDCLSRFREDSELSTLNRRAGQTVRVSETLWQVLNIAIDAAEFSDGIVTPTVLGALIAAGYDRSLAELPPASYQGPAVKAGAQVHDWRFIQLDPTHRSVRVPADMGLDLAGVAKGWAAELAVHYLAQLAPALIDAGGDIVVRGPRADGNPWPIGVDKPFGADDMDEDELPLFLLENGTMATSGRDYRRWQSGDSWRHHLIDPRTGLPAETDVVAASAIAPNAVDAEVAAKVALILGSREGLEWVEAHPDTAVLLILQDMTIVSSSRLSKYIWS